MYFNYTIIKAQLAQALDEKKERSTVSLEFFCLVVLAVAAAEFAKERVVLLFAFVMQIFDWQRRNRTGPLPVIQPLAGRMLFGIGGSTYGHPTENLGSTPRSAGGRAKPGCCALALGRDG